MVFQPQPKPEKQEKKKPARIKPRSSKRAQQEREYTALAKVYLYENKKCVPCGGVSVQVHHKKGRIGDLILDVEYFLPVCATCHDFIERNPKVAKERGWSLNRLSK